MTPALTLERLVADRIRESIAVKQVFLESADSLAMVTEAAGVLIECLHKRGKVFFFGNGGSAADAQHLAAELAGRYLLERPGLPGIALTTNTSCLTAIGNDYGYDLVFARQLQALASTGDVAIGISTSGKAENVLRAVTTAKEKGLITIGMTGFDGGRLKPLVDYCFCVPSNQTARIQEVHVLIGHILCEIVEEAIFNGGRLS